MVELISLSGRRVFYLRGTQPACFYLADVHAGGVLVNAPPYAPGLRERLDALMPLRFVFLPSAFGAAGVGAWRAAGVQVTASVEEAASVDATIDQPVDRKVRLLREIDFLPMSGRTRGSCALRVKPSPAIVFFGPHSIMATGRALSPMRTIIPSKTASSARSDCAASASSSRSATITSTGRAGSAPVPRTRSAGTLRTGSPRLSNQEVYRAA